MASDAKKRLVDRGTAVDRISNLPGNVTDHILERLPLHDAARTSILSKTWRGLWGMHPNLVFDEAFFSQLVSKMNNQVRVSKVSKIISNILLVNHGPILKFHLLIPQFMHLHLDADLWIKNISNLGVKDFMLRNKEPFPYKMTSYLFSCLELTHLSLTNCILNPPNRFGGFGNLINVQLVLVKITADMSFGTRLNVLQLDNCTGIEHLECQFKFDNKNLTELIIINCGEFNWKWLECTQKLQILGLLTREVPESRKKEINLEKLVRDMPRIQILFLHSFFLEFLEPGAVTMKRLTTKNLVCMSLHHFEFYDLVRIRNVLCLMSSSTNLRSLYLYMDGKVKSKDGLDLVGSSEHMVGSSEHMVSSVVQYLQSPTLVEMIFDKLQTVKIHNMVGSRAELQFIKLLLASSPLLRWIKLLNTTIDDPKEESRILKELMSFPRASKAAQIIWT
ncbi:F-box domain-containing protein [Heracleum sosnowskyi]|uniref:F-box domain-containing protein n=1 Tax=Heracleum sosnowskyi TaxID=360622 RepID=A0AAD8HWG3_9APIA|nr:F-box domain-containing protein [Heracleum sosnowskyi]